MHKDLQSAVVQGCSRNVRINRFDASAVSRERLRLRYTPAQATFVVHLVIS
jgi:hypothetical protein